MRTSPATIPQQSSSRRVTRSQTITSSLTAKAAPDRSVRQRHEMSDLKTVSSHRHVEPRSDVEEKRQDNLDVMWRHSISQSQNPQATLKGAEQEYTVSDSVFSIQPRALRPPGSESNDERSIDYELLEIIGQGGVGVVYSGRQASIDRSVAIKMLRNEYRDRQDHRDKFLAEAVLTGELDHPNIVPIYDLGRSESGELFYSMKNVVGTPWDRVIASKQLRENLDILLKVADAVAFAHSRGVVHRDLKPENIMLGDFGEVLVMDWGIALPTAEFRKSASILRSQAMGGTPAYMAPEMAQGPVEEIGNAADIYLLGAILFEILTGRPPHYGHDVMQCVRNAAANIIVETDVTGELMEIATKAMSTLPRRRYRTAADFQAAVRLYQSHSDSISLSDNAEIELAEAISQKNYPSFSRATFAFQEALALWPENTPAVEGLKRAQLAHAKAALEKGDIDLGISLLSEDNTEHQTLLGQLNAARLDRDARQGRLKLFKQVAIGLVAFIFTAGSIGMGSILFLLAQSSRLNGKLTAASNELTNEIKNVKQARDEAKEQERNAHNQTEQAEKQRKNADAARRSAELARLESIAQKQKAEESSYFAEASLVAASIEQNGFNVAVEVLDRQMQSPAKSKLRHWEWGRHRYLVQGGRGDDDPPIVTTHSTDISVESVDSSNDGKWIAVGLTSGDCQLWKQGEMKPTYTIHHGKTLRDLDFDTTGQLLVTCGVEDEQTGSIKVWQVYADREPTNLETIQLERSVVQTVAFSNDTNARTLVAGDNRRMAHVWRWRDRERVATMFGHMDEVTSVKFSPDDRWVGTACLDGTVRLFNATNGNEVQRFAGHRAAVLCLAFTADGKRVASGGAEQEVLLWDVDPTHDRTQQLEDVRRQVAGQTLPAPKFTAFRGHAGAVNDVRFSLDGKLLISGASDSCICLWPVPMSSSSASSPMQLTSMRKQSQDSLLTRHLQVEDQPSNSLDSMPSIKPLLKLRGHGGWIRSCCFSANGQTVYSGSVDRSWRDWRIADYHEQRVMGDRGVAITDVHYSPDGQTVAAAYDDGLIELWSAASGTRQGLLNEGHEYLTNRAAFIADGQRLITAAGDNTLRVWDVNVGSQLAVIEHAGHNANFAVSPDGLWLATAGDETGVSISELSALDSGRRLRSRTDLQVDQAAFVEPTCVAISNDGAWLFVGGKNGNCEFWDGRQGKLIHQSAGHADAVVAAFCLPGTNSQSSASASVITVSADGTAAWWMMSSGEERRTRLRHQAAVSVAALSNDGRYLATAATLDRGKSRLWSWDLSSGKQIATRDLQGQFIQDVTSTGDASGSFLVTTSNLENSNKEIFRWSPSDDSWSSATKSKSISSSVWGGLQTPDGSRLLIYGGKGARLSRIEDNAELMHYRPSSSVYCLNFSSDGKLLAAGNEDGSITLWDLQTRRSARKLLGGHKQAVLDLQFSIDNKQLASTGAGGRVALWDLESGQPPVTGRISRTNLRGNSIRYSPDGKTLVIACDDQLLHIHEAQTLRQLFTLKGHADMITCAAYSPDGKWLASGSQDKTIWLWSVEQRREVLKLIGHLAPIHSVEFSGDGLRLLSSSQDSSVKLWDLDNLEEIALREPGASNTIESETGEVLALNYHSGPATSAEFSPSGQDILTAGADGVAIIWPSQSVPPALRLASPAITYDQSGPMFLARLARISQPINSDLISARLTIRLVADPEQPVDQSAQLSIDQSDDVIKIIDRTIQVRDLFGQWVDIGELSRNDASSIEISFTSQVSHRAAQLLLRHITFQRSITEADADRVDCKYELSLTDRHNRSGNAQPEVLVIR